MSKLFNYPICLFVFAPFSYWLGELFIAAYILLLSLCGLATRLMHTNVKMTKISFFAGIFAIFYIAISFTLYKGDLGGLLKFGPTDQTFLLLSAVQFFLLLVIIDLFGDINREQYLVYIKYVFYVFAFSIIIESFATNVLHVPITFFPGYRDIMSYTAPVIAGYHRPFGLIGNAPMNGSALVVFAWLYIGIGKKVGREALYIHFITFMALVANFSAQAMLTYFLSLLLFHGRFSIRNILGVLGLLLLFHLILYYELLGWKLSYVYIGRMLEYLQIGSILEQLTITDYLFGAMSNNPLLTRFSFEMYPFYSIAHFGLILSLTLWCLILFHKSTRPINVALCAVLIGSVHYGTVLTIILQVPLAILLINLKQINRELGVDGYSTELNGVCDVGSEVCSERC